MLPRVLEPEVMDAPEDAQDYNAMGHGDTNVRFVADFRAAHGPCRGGTVLDVGTGTALIPIALCAADPAARVLAVDLSSEMIDLARRNVEDAGLESRIALHQADAKDIGPGYAHFEAAMSNGVLHHIPEPIVALREMVRLVARGGTVFVRDLARPETEEELDRLVDRYAGHETEHARDMYRASLHAALTPDEMRELVRELELPETGVARTSDRHWTWTWMHS